MMRKDTSKKNKSIKNSKITSMDLEQKILIKEKKDISHIMINLKYHLRSQKIEYDELDFYFKLPNRSD